MKIILYNIQESVFGTKNNDEIRQFLTDELFVSCDDSLETTIKNEELITSKVSIIFTRIRRIIKFFKVLYTKCDFTKVCYRKHWK